MSKFLQDLIPSSNLLEAGYCSTAAAKTRQLESAYEAGFVGAFADNDDFPDWARRAARYLDDEFRELGGIVDFEQLAGNLPAAAGECHVPLRHALELWKANGTGVQPYSMAQDYGSCVDCSADEGVTGLLGWRAAHPDQIDAPEEYRHPAAWYWYAGRGYCSDGWSGGGVATQARKHGVAFRIPYDLAGNQVDFTDDDRNEQIVARTWCRSGIPAWLSAHTSANHAFEDGAITQFGSQGGQEALDKIRRAVAAGGFIHHSGTRTSGGSRPFTIGSTGAHMQTLHGYDDSDQFRKFCQDVLRITPRDNDFPVINHQTWGAGWRGECADQYWPAWWGPKPQGAWVWWASDMLRLISLDYVWLPWVKGFPATTPPPPPPPAPSGPTLTGRLFAEQAGPVIAIRGELTAEHGGTSQRYIIVPDGSGGYVPFKPLEGRKRHSLW